MRPVLLIPTHLPLGTSIRSVVNISNKRREKEIFDIIKEMRLANLASKEILEKHRDHITALSQSGVPASAPAGTSLDKRTLLQSVESLVEQGRLKILSTTTYSVGGFARPTKVAYVDDVSTEELSNFLESLGKRPGWPGINRFKKLETHVEYNTSRGLITEHKIALEVDRVAGANGEWEKDEDRARRIASLDPAQVRSILLTEPATIAQLYGYISGRFMRARELHLFPLHHLHDASPLSEHVVSVDHRIIATSYFTADLPVGTYCSIFSTVEHEPLLEEYLRDTENRSVPVKDLPPALLASLNVGKARAKAKLHSLLGVLVALELVTPLKPVDTPSPYISCTSLGEHPSAFDIDTIAAGSSFPLYCKFNDTAPLFGFASSDSDPPYLGDVSIKTMPECVHYWLTLRSISDTSLKNENPIIEPVDSRSFGPNKEIMRSIRRHTSWLSTYRLSWYQYQYLKSRVDAETAQTPLDDLDTTRLDLACYATAAPEQAVREGLQQAAVQVLNDFEKARRREHKRLEAEARNRRADAKKENNARTSLAAKAADAKERLEKEWRSLVDEARGDAHYELDAPSNIELNHLRTEFIRKGGNTDRDRLKATIHGILTGLGNNSRARLPVRHLTQRNRPALQSASPSSSWLGGSRRLKKTVEELIKQQMLLLRPASIPGGKKRKGRGKVTISEPGTSRPCNFSFARA